MFITAVKFKVNTEEAVIVDFGSNHECTNLLFNQNLPEIHIGK